MIENFEQLEVSVIQLGRMYAVLASLRQKIPDNRRFAFWAEGPIGQIEQIQKEIDAFTGLDVAAPIVAENEARYEAELELEAKSGALPPLDVAASYAPHAAAQDASM